MAEKAYLIQVRTGHSKYKGWQYIPRTLSWPFEELDKDYPPLKFDSFGGASHEFRAMTLDLLDLLNKIKTMYKNWGSTPDHLDIRIVLAVKLKDPARKAWVAMDVLDYREFDI